MIRKIKAEITQPVQEADGSVLQPGTRFDENNTTLKDLPPGHVRYVIVEEDDPEPKPVKASTKSAGGGVQ